MTVKSLALIGAALTMVAGAPALAQTMATGQIDTALLRMKVNDLEDKAIYGAEGEEFGEIDDVVRGPDGQLHAVVEAGSGFLGIGGTTVLVPLSQFRVEGDRLMLPAMTAEQAEALPEHTGDQAYAEVEEDDRTLGEIMGAR